jgi:signal transduction histidine kinase
MAAVLEDYQRPDAGGEIDTVRALLHDLRQPLAAILLLAGTDGGDVGRKMEGIAGQARWLAELVEAVLSDAASDEATTSCEIVMDAVDDVEVWARPVALSRALACVLDNAVRAAGEGGHVTVGVQLDCAGVHLTVSDDGPGLGFVAARTSLGLTTTRAMVAACNGSFELYAGRDGGVVADICLAEAGIRSVAS